VRMARAVLRGSGLALITAAGLPVVALLRLQPLGARLSARLSARVVRLWASVATRLLGMRLRSSGPIPTVPFVLVANHLGYVDIVALASRLDCTFVARADLAGWPILGALSSVIGAIYVDRQRPRSLRAAITGIEGALGEGRGVVIFPEGTTTAGDGVLPFRSSLLEGAARARRPVHHARLAYRAMPGEKDAGTSICWWGEMTFWRHLAALLAHPGFAARIAFGPRPITSTDRKVLAEALWRQVRSGRRQPAY